MRKIAGEVSALGKHKFDKLDVKDINALVAENDVPRFGMWTVEARKRGSVEIHGSVEVWKQKTRLTYPLKSGSLIYGWHPGPSELSNPSELI